MADRGYETTSLDGKRRIHITASERMAAQLLVKLRDERGVEVGAAVQAIANSTPTPERPMSDRRAEAFAVLDEREAEARTWVGSLTSEPGLGYENLFRAVLTYLTALRSVLEMCEGWEGWEVLAGDLARRIEQTMIDALLGETGD